jgi:hypothetical protein
MGMPERFWILIASGSSLERRIQPVQVGESKGMLASLILLE